MERESNYNNNRFDPFEEYFRKKKKVMMRIPISLQKNQNHLIINSIRKLIDKFFKMIKIERF